jgi:hypothetical protein
MARWCLTVRRVRFLATSYWGRVRYGWLARAVLRERRDVVRDKIVPQRYPSCACVGRAWSRLFCEGSCAAGRGTRSCHSGSGRPCCRRGRRACPVTSIIVSFSFMLHLRCLIDFMLRLESLLIEGRRSDEDLGGDLGTDLARVDFGGAEGIVVGTHVDDSMQSTVPKCWAICNDLDQGKVSTQVIRSLSWDDCGNGLCAPSRNLGKVVSASGRSPPIAYKFVAGAATFSSSFMRL